MAVTEMEAWDDEALDDEVWDDEPRATEGWDDESEFLGSLLGGPAQLIGNALGGIFGSSPSPRAVLPQVSIGLPGRGVSTATLSTPAGSATLRLPEPVVTRQEFEAGIRTLQSGINRDAARVNALGRDLDTLRTRVGAVVADTQKDIAKLRSETTRTRTVVRRQIAKLRADQGQQQMMSMIMSMIMQSSAQEALESHTHPIETGARVTGPANVQAGDNNMGLMMLPLMMSPGGSDSMLPLAMMMAFR